MWPFTKNEIREETSDEALLTALSDEVQITKDNILNIPAVAGAIELISNTFAMIPIKLYKKSGDSSEYIEKDKRNILLNKETGDTLTAYEMKIAMCRDYLINGGGYAYIKKNSGAFDSLYYVDCDDLSVMEGNDPIFKTNLFNIYGKTYQNYEFVSILRHTKNGATGSGIITENAEQLKLMYSLISFENKMISRGGIKSGYLESDHQLTTEAFKKLKAAWKELFKSKGENAVVLNNGVKFKEASSTATELQLNESKKQNSNDVCKMFNMPENMLSGSAHEETYKLFIKQTIMPICEAFEKSLNRNLLLETEKETYYFAFDYTDLIKASAKDRFEAYSVAIKNGFMTVNEVREREAIKDIDGLDIISMNLGNVVYDINEKKYFTPNTGQVIDLTKIEENQNGNSINGTREDGVNDKIANTGTGSNTTNFT